MKEGVTGGEHDNDSVCVGVAVAVRPADTDCEGETEVLWDAEVACEELEVCDRE